MPGLLWLSFPNWRPEGFTVSFERRLHRKSKDIEMFKLLLYTFLLSIIYPYIHLFFGQYKKKYEKMLTVHYLFSLVPIFKAKMSYLKNKSVGFLTTIKEVIYDTNKYVCLFCMDLKPVMFKGRGERWGEDESEWVSEREIDLWAALHSAASFE